MPTAPHTMRPASLQNGAKSSAAAMSGMVIRCADSVVQLVFVRRRAQKNATKELMMPAVPAIRMAWRPRDDTMMTRNPYEIPWEMTERLALRAMAGLRCSLSWEFASTSLSPSVLERR